MRISKNYASHCLGLDPHSPTHPTSKDEILDKVTSTSFTKAFTVIAFVGNVSDQQVTHTTWQVVRSCVENKRTKGQPKVN